MMVKTNLQFVSTADMQKDAKDLSLKFYHILY